MCLEIDTLPSCGNGAGKGRMEALEEVPNKKYYIKKADAPLVTNVYS
ncbi:hypothetical protein [Syntrophotalea acetylenica]|nr:hypothetical protein [Syntrophotalea acetylenica]MDY0260972.1 hypothetical protein [Syntrophotalea acetylenica]